MIMTAQSIGMSPDDFFMMITSVSFNFMDEQLHYKDLEQLKKHFMQLCESYWEHRPNENT